MCKTIYLRYKISPENLCRATPKYCEMRNPLYAMSGCLTLRHFCKFGHSIKQETRTCDQRDLHVCLNITWNRTIPFGAFNQDITGVNQKMNCNFDCFYIEGKERRRKIYSNIFFAVPRKLSSKREGKREKVGHIFTYFRSQILFSLQLRFYDTIFRKI